MAEYPLPEGLSVQWSSSGDILKPSDTKIQQGWVPEIPTRQYFNWLDNRQDAAIAHIVQHGISLWVDDMQYQAGKSYVQGSNGFIYRALTTNINIDPVGGAPGNWTIAFTTPSTATQVASTAQAQAQTANNVYISPLALGNAFKGSNQILTGNGFQKLPGGLILQYITATNPNTTNASGTISVTYPVSFPTAVLGFSHMEFAVAGNKTLFSFDNQTTSGCDIHYIRQFGSTTSGCRLIVIGY